MMRHHNYFHFTLEGLFSNHIAANVLRSDRYVVKKKYFQKLFH